MKALLFILLFLSTTIHAETFYYPNTEKSLFSLSKTLRQTGQGIEVILTIKNTTDEVNGNGLEQIIEGIEIQYPLAPREWFALSDTHVSRGTVEVKEQELPMCQPTMLGRLKGFEQGNETLSDELAAHFETAILPRMMPNLSYWLVGHTDTKGKASYNEKLSLQRAEAVKQTLEEKGFETKHITAFGEGENSPLSLEQDDESHKLNRRVEIYPKQHSKIYWQLSELKPDETAELAFILRPNSWATKQELDTVLHNQDCYQLKMQHQYTIPTHAELVLRSYIKPAAKKLTQTADVSACDSIDVELTIDNYGARSANDIKLMNILPLELQTVHSKEFKQRSDKQYQYLDWTQKRLYPNKSIKLTYQIQPLFLSRFPQGMEQKQTLCTSKNSTFFGIGCLVAKQFQQNLQPEMTTQTLYVNLEAKGYPLLQAQNTVRWHMPSISLQTRTQQLQYAGEIINQALVITNNGNESIKQLKIVADLPKNIHSVAAFGTQEKTEEQLIWMLGELPPQAQQEVQLSFIPRGNQSDLVITQFLVYDQAYGTKRCIQANAQMQTLIKPLLAPRLALRAEHETIAVGKHLFYQVELKNPNDIDLAYNLTAQVDPKMWQQTRQVVTGILHAAKKQTTMKLLVNILPTGEIVIMQNRSRSITIPAQSKLLFNFTLTAKALSEHTLQAIAANLTSEFSVANIQIKVQSHHKLIENEQKIMTVVYK